MRRIRRILHATDFSRASTPALRWAIAMAKANRARLTVVHVMAPPALALPGEGYVSPTLYESLESSARGAAQKRLKVVVARVQAIEEHSEKDRPSSGRDAPAPRRLSRSTGPPPKR